MVCNYVKDRALTVDVLWEVVYGVFRETLCLDSLEDFNAMEVDLMELKDNILSIWKARDKCKTSSLGPMFVLLSVRAGKKKSTLGDTFSPSSAIAPAPICQSLFSRLSYAVGGVQSPLAKPMGLPPGISYPSVSVPYRQGVLPTPGYTPWGLVMGYNFDPMMGQPLRPAVPYSYPFMSQSSDILLSTSFHLSLTDLPPLIDEDDEETPPLVVGPPSCSSHIVTSGAVPSMTVSLAGAETLLSASPRVNLRMSTPIASSANQDICRVVQQRPPTSANAALVDAGVGWGQVIAGKLRKHRGAGKGHADPSPSVLRIPGTQERDKEFADARVSADLPPPITMNLDLQGLPVSYADTASKLPKKKSVTEDSVHLCNV